MAYTLTKKEIVDFLASKIGLNKREAQDLVNQYFEELSLALEKGEEIKLSGLGCFCLRDKKARIGRNPKTKESYQISARRVASFKPSRALRNLLRYAVMASETGQESPNAAA